MKTQSYSFLLLMVFAFLLLQGSRPDQNTFDKISVREFELVDQHGKQRVSIKVEPDGEVVFRLKDSNETIRVKLGASEEGSGLVLLNDQTNVGVHALAKKKETSLTVMDKDGKKREY